MAKWQMKYRVDWDATDGRNGAAQQTVWETLMEMARFYGKAKEEDQGAVDLFLDLAKVFERVSFLWSGPGQHTSVTQARFDDCFAVISSTG